MKTPEELAEELDRQAVLYVSLKARNDVSYYVGMDCYKAGYKAAQEHAHAALEEAEVRIRELKDQLADADKVMPDSCEHILDMEKMVDVHGWISVHDRLPDHEREVFITDGLTVSAARYYKYGGWGVTLGRGNKYWMEKPELPEEI